MLSLDYEEARAAPKAPPRWQVRLSFCIQIYLALGMTTLLLLAILLAPAAHDAATMVRGNKDRINRTITSVLHVSEQAEVILLDIRSFLEFKLTDALCSSSIIRKLLGGFCNSEDSRRSFVQAFDNVSILEMLLTSTICSETTPECELLNQLHRDSILSALNKTVLGSDGRG